MKDIQLTFLGSGNAFSPSRYWSSILVGDNILLDCSPIVLPHLRMMKKDPAKVTHVLVTHLHGDHIFGLPFFFLDSMYISERKVPIHIAGPDGIEKSAEDLLELAFPGANKNFGHRIEREYFPISGEGLFEMGQMSFTTRRMDHGGTVAYGYRFEIEGRVVAYSGDTGLCHGLKGLVEGCDIAMVEMSSVDSSIPGHMDLKDVEKLVSLLKPEGTLIATHLPETVPEAASDERIRFASDKTVMMV